MSKLPTSRAAMPKVQDKISRGIGKLPCLEFVRSWRVYAKGAIIKPYSAMIMQDLLDRGVAKLYEPKPVKAAPVVEDKPRNPGKTRTSKPDAKTLAEDHFRD